MTTFELIDTNLGELAQDQEVFGLWSVSSPLTNLSFNTNSPTAQSQPGQNWRVNLSDNLSMAKVDLEQAQQQIQTSQFRLCDASQGLSEESLAHMIALPSYSIKSYSTAKEELSDAIETAKRLELQPEPSPELSRWQQASQALQQHIRQFTRSVLNYAWVETSVGGNTFARTSMNWGGDVQSIWQPWTLAAQRRLHQQSVQLAIDSRLMLVRVFGLIAEGILHLSKVSTPITAVLAAPGIWRYVNRVIKEFQPD